MSPAQLPYRRPVGWPAGKLPLVSVTTRVAAQKAKLQTAVGQLKAGIASADMTAAAKAGTDASETIASAK